jgi:hypothetical protein
MILIHDPIMSANTFDIIICRYVLSDVAMKQLVVLAMLPVL